MKRLLLALAVLVCVAPALGAPGDSWILPIDHMDGSFTAIPGAGYAGGTAYQGTGFDGVRRIFWAMGNQAGMPATKELFTVSWFVPTQGNENIYNPIESANVGELEGVMNASIPWGGQFGTNHQWLSNNDGAANANRGTFLATGPGPQAPESTLYGAGGSGIYMWLDGSASLYAKYNFGFYNDNSSTTWSALQVTQITPEPASLLGLGFMSLMALRRRRTR